MGSWLVGLVGLMGLIDGTESAALAVGRGSGTVDSSNWIVGSAGSRSDGVNSAGPVGSRLDSVVHKSIRSCFPSSPK